ncbi:MAG: glycosyltransferase family 9 protein [Humidesulfovibrio sp.]|nr:glycosyltransferase family 9 protein [Humidesulfovibrio sp.]
MAGERGNRLLRVIDKWVGIPLIVTAGLLRRRRKPPASLRRVGVLCLGCIGDLILLSGPIADLLAAHPDVRLTIFCSGPNQEIAHMIIGAAEVVVLPVKRPWEAVRLVRASGRFDAWIDSGQWPRLNALLSFAARSAFTVGFRSPGQHRHYVYDAVASHLRTRHELENFRALTAALSVPGRSLPALAPRPKALAELPGGVLPQGPYAVLHLFPGGYRAGMKQWPLERWAEVAAELTGRGLFVLLSGGPADAPQAEALVRKLASPRIQSIAGDSLSTTGAMLAFAALVVSVNTGIMHLAAALGAPLIALNGPTSVDRWGPVTLPGGGEALCSGRACAPCLHLGFEYACEMGGCMADIGVADVLAAADRLLAATGGGAAEAAD